MSTVVILAGVAIGVFSIFLIARGNGRGANEGTALPDIYDGRPSSDAGCADPGRDGGCGDGDGGDSGDGGD